MHRGKSQAGIEMQRLQLFCKKKNDDADRCNHGGKHCGGNNHSDKRQTGGIANHLEKIFSLTRLKTGQTAENYISNNILKIIGGKY